MGQTLEEKLLNIIKKDDVKAFSAVAKDVRLGSCRMGRFPILSLLYLFGARRILSKFEERFARISVWDPIGEPAGAARAFAEKAGKCLRLYFDEVVSPIEMALILDMSRRVKKLYPTAKPSEPVRNRLKKIYYIKYSRNIKFTGNEMIMERRPLNRREKKRIALAAIGCLLIVAIIIATPVTAVTLLPDRSKGEVTKLKHIDLASTNSYILKKDIVLPDDFTADEVNCSITGGGGKLIFGKNVTLGQFNGSLKDLEIITSGSPMFEVCTNLAHIQNVTVNVAADVEMKADSAFVAITNYGSFEGVKLNVGGKISALASGETTDGESEDLVFGGLAANNTYAVDTLGRRIYGTIRNCTVRYSDLRLEGELSANASFGGLVGINTGIVEDCSVEGNIAADTFDVAGACYVNGYQLTRIANFASLSQTAEDEGWTTVIGGIVIENASSVEYCKNSGGISAVSVGAAICGGIAARSYGQTNYCLSDGAIAVQAKTAFVGGIFGRSEVTTNRNYVYIGIADYCVSESDISASLGEGTSCVGGIGGLVQEGAFEQYVLDENGFLVYGDDGNILTETVYWGGGARNCVFIGKAEGNAQTFGGIIGGVGEHIYRQNYYLEGETERHNFEGNCYVPTAQSAFGATIASDASLSKA